MSHPSAQPSIRQSKATAKNMMLQASTFSRRDVRGAGSDEFAGMAFHS
jgi:hypothetical protein